MSGCIRGKKEKHTIATELALWGLYARGGYACFHLAFLTKFFYFFSLKIFFLYFREYFIF